tara:strand:- start:491 stop:2056 length:1566 start_codon:yes stop_codon:yes gene_type:complete
MKFCKNLILFLSFSLICSCGTNEQINETTKNSTNQTINENEENSDKEVASSEEKSTPSQEAVNEIIQEFPNGLVSFLSKTERICLFETASSLVIRQMEVDLMEGRKISEENLEYFKSCNIPPPPEPSNINNPVQGKPGTSPPPNDKGTTNQAGMGQTTPLSSIHLSYLGSIKSMENGLGNIADPSIVETPDGNLRVYFKNGNEPQANINGYDNLIHSAISEDGGRNWIVEQGVRIPVNSPVEALFIEGKTVAWGWELAMSGDSLVRYESFDGINFQKVNIPVFYQSDCKDTSGNSTGPLGDPSITLLNDGSWIFHAQELVSPLGDFKRRGCVATSEDGISWTSQPTRMYGGADQDVTTNPAIKLNSSGIVEWIWPSTNFMAYRKGTDSFNWSEPEYLPNGGDPDLLDLNNGRKLLAFGNFNPRIGGVLIFTERIKSNYKITVVDSGPTQIPTKKWLVEGANPSDIKVVNLCLDTDLSTAQGATVEINQINGQLEVIATDSNEKFSSPTCVYILVGPEQVMG